MNLQEFDNLAKSGRVKATISVSVFKIPRYVDKVMCGLGGVRFMIEENETDRP